VKKLTDVWEKAIAIGALVIVVGFYALVIYGTPSFESFYYSDFYRGDIPIITQLVFRTYTYWIIFGLLGLVGGGLILLRRDRRGWFLLNTAIGSVLVLLPVWIFAMYYAPGWPPQVVM
jgi:hypothetical protein